LASNPTTNVTINRRRNAQTLFQAYAEDMIAKGAQPKGLELGFAELLGVSAVTWSHAKSGRRPIGDKLARQIEFQCGKAVGWLDEEREPEGLSQAEQAFLALALKAWRRTNSAGRKALRALLSKDPVG
jgi:hypothetical protein